MIKNSEFYQRGIVDAPEILAKIQEYSSGKTYHNEGSVEWCPEVGPSWVPAGRYGRHETISFGFTNTLEGVLAQIQEDQQ